jgi:hypothetical protein
MVVKPEQTSGTVTMLREEQPGEQESILGRGRNCSILLSVQTGSETHSASHPTGTRDYFSGSKAART